MDELRPVSVGGWLAGSRAVGSAGATESACPSGVLLRGAGTDSSADEAASSLEPAREGDVLPSPARVSHFSCAASGKVTQVVASPASGLLKKREILRWAHHLFRRLKVLQEILLHVNAITPIATIVVIHKGHGLATVIWRPTPKLSKSWRVHKYLSECSCRHC